MKKSPTDVAYFALQSTVSGLGNDRYLIPDRAPIVIPRTTYIVPILSDCIAQSEPHGLGVVLWIDSTNWFMAPAFSVDDRVLAVRLSNTRETRVYDSWLQCWDVWGWTPKPNRRDVATVKFAQLLERHY